MRLRQTRTDRENHHMARRLVSAVLSKTHTWMTEAEIAELNLLVFQMLEDWPI